ncbi:MAG: hypothetical protein RDU25_01570 [Patescibacteria group bacterium]|nr:hypothetical protein [Patescibacteria group bacterium]
MPDPRIEFWTAAWRKVVDEYIATPAWKYDLALLGLNEDELSFVIDLMRVLVRLPQDAGGDDKLLIEAWQKGELPVIRSLYHEKVRTPRSTQLEALARGEVKTISFTVRRPAEDSADSDDDVLDRPTPLYELAPVMGEVMDSHRVIGSDVPEVRGLLPTIPVPAPEPELLRQSMPSTHDAEDGFGNEETPTAKRPVRILSGLSQLFLPKDLSVASRDDEPVDEFDLASPDQDEPDDFDNGSS